MQPTNRSSRILLPVNTVSVGLFAWKGLWLTTVLYGLFLLMSLWGWRAWVQLAAARQAP